MVLPVCRCRSRGRDGSCPRSFSRLLPLLLRSLKPASCVGRAFGQRRIERLRLSPRRTTRPSTASSSSTPQPSAPLDDSNRQRQLHGHHARPIPVRRHRAGLRGCDLRVPGLPVGLQHRGGLQPRSGFSTSSDPWPRRSTRQASTWRSHRRSPRRPRPSGVRRRWSSSVASRLGVPTGVTVGDGTDSCSAPIGAGPASSPRPRPGQARHGQLHRRHRLRPDHQFERQSSRHRPDGRGADVHPAHDRPRPTGEAHRDDHGRSRQHGCAHGNGSIQAGN